MAYRDVRAEEEPWLGGRGAVPQIRLGDAERQVILRARRDVQAHRAGQRQDDPRLEALRLYAMLGRYRRDAAHSLLAAGFSPAERRVIDAMLDALPLRGRSPQPATGRLVCAVLIMLPLLAAGGAFGWASLHLQDRLIALVVGGMALLLLAPLANALAPTRRPNC